ncbi:MAG: hypothetical protein VX127_16845 [Myxococcota bacterium]|nr:hypothetical protein [Myxococcota bacterium]
MPPWILPALFASAVAIGVTVAIERMGGKKGGLIGSLPTTIIPASVGLYSASPTIPDFQGALFITPIGMLLNSLFLFVWRLVPPRLPSWPSTVRLLTTLTVALVGWGMLAALFVSLGRALEGGLGLASFTVMGVSAATGIWACHRNPPSPKQRRRVGPITLVARGALAGLAIGLSVWLGTKGTPLIAGLAAVFPAIYMTTMVSLWLSHGEAVGAGAIGPMMLGGTSVSMFAWVAAWTIPAVGAMVGCLAAWLAAVSFVTVPAWRWLNPSPAR